MTNLDVVRAVWTDLLGVPDPQPDDDFFTHGGDSLSLLTLADRLRERLHRDVAAHRLLNNPTVAGMAATLDELESPLVAAAGPRAVPTSRWQSHALERARDGDGTVPAAYAFTLTGSGSPPADIHTAVQALVSRHTALRTYFPSTLVARLSDDLECPIHTVERPLSALLAPFDPTVPPLFRAVIAVRPGRYTLGFAASDLIMDPWSVPSFVAGLTSPTASSDFTGFAAAERQRLSEPLPFGAGNPAVLPDEQERVLEPDEVRRMTEFCRAHRVTPFTTLVAAVLRATRDSRVLLRLANRSDPHLIGPYQTFAPLCLSDDPDGDLARAAQHVRDADITPTHEIPRLAVGLLPRPRPSVLGEFTWLATGRSPTPAAITWIPTDSGAILRASYPSEWASQLNTLLSELVLP